MKCKGIVAISPGDPRLIDVDVPDPGPHEVQVKMAATLVSAGTERAWVNGIPNATPAYPYIPGYCCAGEVVKTGSEVVGFEPGDRVATFAVDVGHREIGNVRDLEVVHIPEGVSYEHAAFTSLGQTSLQGVRKCKIELGESVASLGLGIVGILAMQFTHLAGAQPAIALDRVEKRLEIARVCNADIAINNGSEGWETFLKDVTDGKGPAVVLDNTGVPAATVSACQIAADYARICILGCPRGTVDFNFYREVQKKSITVIGAHAVDSIPLYSSYPHFWTYKDDATCFLRFVKSGSIKLDPMIDEVVEKKDAESAYKHLIKYNKEALGMIIKWQ